MKGSIKRILTGMLAGIMVFTTAVPSQLQAAEVPQGGTETGTQALSFSGDDLYAIVTPENTALTVTGTGWGTPLELQKGIYDKNTEKVQAAGAFSVIQTEDQTGLEEDQVRVKIFNRYYDPSDPTIGIVMEDAGAAGWAWADRGADTNSNAVFVITKTGEDTGVIRRNDSVKCLAVSTEDGTKVARAENEEEAAEFRFAKVKGIINTDITIEHKKTGKFIKTAPTAADGITKVTLGEKDDEGTVFSNAVFGESSTSTASGESYKTVSFISQNYGNGIASARWVDGAYADYLFKSLQEHLIHRNSLHWQ